jgi:2-polyprenyl-3-methyl-5-hydroxy-6-metoxy-1,4-benzoquinol methylase
MAKRQLGEVAGLRVLEIGCGRGGFASYLASRGARLTAADFSPAAVEIASEVLSNFPEAEAMVADVLEIPFPDDSFDLVVSLETLEHVPDPDQGLRELVRVTKPGGRLIVTTPNYLSILGLYRFAMKLAGKEFSETGQPINQPVTLVGRTWKLRRLGCKVTAVDGRLQSIPIPRYRTVQAPFLEHPRLVMKWFCHHGLTAAVKGAP